MIRRIVDKKVVDKKVVDKNMIVYIFIAEK